MAFTFVNVKDAAPGGAATTMVFGALSVTAGNLLVVGVAEDVSHTVSSITDDIGNTFASSGQVVTNSTDHRLELWYAISSGTNAADVITVNYSGSSSGRRGSVAQYSGNAASSVFDVADNGNSAGSSVSTITSTAITTAQASELLIGWGRNGNGGTMSAGTGYTMRSASSGFGLEDQEVSSTGSYTATETCSLSGPMTIIIASFKAPAAGSIPNHIVCLKQAVNRASTY